MTAPQLADGDRPHRGRRLTWEEFTKLTGREPPKAANENNASLAKKTGLTYLSGTKNDNSR